jgi:hypothetical protein
MSLAHGASIVRDGLVLHYDTVNSKDDAGINALKNLAGNSLYNATRAFTSGTTTVEEVTYNRVDLAYRDTTGIVYSPKPPLLANKDSPTYYGQGGNWFQVNYDVPWGTGDFTWIVWVYFNSLIAGGLTGDTASPYILDWKRNSGQNSSFQPGINGRPVISYRSTISPFTTTSVTSNVDLYTTGKWNYMCVRRSSGIVNFFNGVNKSSDLSFSVNYEVADDLGIGWGADNDYQWRTLDGIIGAIKIYNRALSDAEINQNFNALRGRYGI